MSRLLPLKHLDKRREKVAGHYFRSAEEWWTVSEQANEQWSSDHRLLEEAGALGPGGWLTVDHARAPADAFDRGHRFWFTVAEQTFQTGDAYAHQDADKRYYVGSGGVLAVVAAPDERPQLVTAFRPDPPVSGNRVGEGATRAYLARHSSGAVRRAAVRRSVRGASR